MKDLLARITNLTELYDRLSVDSRIVVNTDNPDLPSYLTTHFNKDYACVQIASQSKNTTGPTHTHEASEWFFVLKGLIRVDYDLSKEIRQGDILEVLGGIPHTITALEESIFIVITMPSILKELSLSSKS